MATFHVVQWLAENGVDVSALNDCIIRAAKNGGNHEIVNWAINFKNGRQAMH